MKFRFAPRIAQRLPARCTALAVAALPMIANAGLPDLNGKATQISTWLASAGVALFTAAIIWAGYKMAFQEAHFRDVSHILWGGVLFGGAATIAAWLAGG